MVGAGGLYKGNALCKTLCNKGSGREPIRVVFKAPLEPKLGLLIKPSKVVWMALSWEEECLSVAALEWGAEEAVSASRNKSESARATVIDQSSWSFVQQAHQWRAWPVSGFDKGYCKPEVRPLHWRNTKSPTKSFLLLFSNGLADPLSLKLLKL